MRTVVSYDDLPHSDVAIGDAQPRDAHRKKRVKYVGAHWDDVNNSAQRTAPAWSQDDDEAVIASPSTSPSPEPVILPGTAVPLDSNDIWDDRFLVDVWEAAEHEYAEFHQRRTHALDNDTKWARLGSAPVDTKRDTPGWIKAQQLVAETTKKSSGTRAKTDTNDAPSTRAQGTSAPAAPPCAPPPFPEDEALQNLVMAWFYSGYYTAMYQKK